eukprot:11957573-Karenia_brevis.AAC.1
MRSVVGSLSWIARQLRPEYAYLTSNMQSVVSCAQVKQLEACDRILQDMKSTADIGLTFMTGKFEFSDSLLITCTDASWAHDTKYVRDRVFART